MKRSIGMLALGLIMTTSNGTATASSERGDDGRAKVKNAHARPALVAVDDSLKRLRLEGTDRFDDDSAGKGNRDKAHARSGRDETRGGRLSDEDSDSDGKRAPRHLSRAPKHYAIPGEWDGPGGRGRHSDEDSDSDDKGAPGHLPRPGDHHAIPVDGRPPTSPIPEPFSGILFAAGALIVGYAVRGPFGSGD